MSTGTERTNPGAVRTWGGALWGGSPELKCGLWKGRPGAQRGEEGIVQTGHPGAQNLGFKVKQRAKIPRQDLRRHTVHSRAAQESIVGIMLMQTWEGVQT